MAAEEHLEILKRGKDVWNSWMKSNWKDLPKVEITLQGTKKLESFLYMPSLRADLSGLDLTNFKTLKGYNFYKVNFSNCILKGIDFTGSEFRKAHLQNADLTSAVFDFCNLEYALLIHSNLNQSSFKRANLEGANLSDTSLFKTNFSNAILSGSSLMWAKIIETNFRNSDLTNTRVYGASIWNSDLENSMQSNIIISKRNEFDITVDNLEIAQFLYLIISNKKIKNIIDTLTSKIILILGNFSPERKEILDKLKVKLSQLNYIPVVFDFQKPSNKDFIEPISIIAGLSKFVIADFTNPRIVIEEVPAIARNSSTVILPILETGCREPETLYNLRINLRSIAHTVYYENINDLLKVKLEGLLNKGNEILQDLKSRRENGE